MEGTRANGAGLGGSTGLGGAGAGGSGPVYPDALPAYLFKIRAPAKKMKLKFLHCDCMPAYSTPIEVNVIPSTEEDDPLY
jgi:hypothetical protein